MDLHERAGSRRVLRMHGELPEAAQSVPRLASVETAVVNGAAPSEINLAPSDKRRSVRRAALRFGDRGRAGLGGGGARRR